jgi:hypothetical protein
MIISSLYRESNLIIFNTFDIHNIPFKDNNILRLFPVIRFPNIDNNSIMKYISYTILKFGYNPKLYDINWSLYDFSKMNFEKINILLFELDSIIRTNNNNFYVNDFITRAISDLSNIYIKY